MKEIYVSTDVEADGPIPGVYSMLSFGSAAYGEDGNLIATYTVNLQTLPDAKSDPDTMMWWSGLPEAWAAATKNPQPPEQAMPHYVKWVKRLGRRPVFVGYPAGFDFTFMYWYLMRFAGESPFSFAALDIKTYAMALLGTKYRETVKRNFKPEWFDGVPKHTHYALDDAIEQGKLFMNMLLRR